MTDYIVDDLLNIKPLGSPFAEPWNGCLFIGTEEECTKWVQKRSGGTNDGKKSVDSASERSGLESQVLRQPLGCKTVGSSSVLQLLDRGGERMSKVWQCSVCGETYTADDLDELEETGEAFTVLGDPAESDQMICPDCLDRWNRMSEDEKFDALMKTEG